MCGNVPFRRVRDLFKKHEYELMGWWRGRPVFDRPNDPNGIVFVVPLDENKCLCEEEFNRLKGFFDDT